MSERLLLIAAGGTGGHMFPAQALAETMLVRGWRVQRVDLVSLNVNTSLSDRVWSRSH